MDVALFGFEGELQLDPEADVGRLRIDEDGCLHVRIAVAGPHSPDPKLSGSLFFPLRTPKREGAARLRCNVYCEGVLVQSRLVSALVAREWAGPLQAGGVLASELEYSLSRSLHSAQLAKLPPADLSLMVNGDQDRHQFRLYAPGDDENPVITSSATVEASELTKPIEYCRAGLRKASWGDEDEWQKGVPPKYSAAGSPEQLESDLLDLAIRGRLAYTAIIDRLVEDREVRRELQGIRYHARIELAAAPERFVPAALFYDAPLAPGANLSELTLCSQFVAAREDPDVALEDCACLNGSCPGWEEKTIVCPGGFWGFRHAMGWPVSLDDGDALGVLAYESSLRAAMASADDLAGVAQHRKDVGGLLHDLDDAPDLAELLKLLAAHSEQLVYLYCHGGETPGRVPYVRIGDPRGPRLTRGEIFDLDLEGRSSLIFLNGCTTTAVSPESQFDLVDAFIQYGGAVGVIGTEITVFEPMAAPFALDFFQAFVGERATVGEAIRHARLAALKRGNPLGLAYVPFVLGGMTLEAVGMGPGM
ncbi:MAG TPA: C25 family cysteine peptidase [Solirubrobacterales bacterium]|nr:C25 family cysteine peptidase [Solirubrobacterales bacterium]